jgi:hypothetical protein
MTALAPDPWHCPTPILDALEAQTPAMRAAWRRVEFRHIQALLKRGVPIPDMLGKFGVVVIQGREMIVTDDARLRGYLDGPVMAAMPE